MFKQLAAIYLLHDNMDELLSLINLFHLNYVLMANEPNDLDLLPQKVLFSLGERSLIDLFHCNDILCVFVLTLVNRRKLAISKLSPLNVSLLKIEIISLLSHMSDPVLYYLLVHVEQLSFLNSLVLV